MSAAVRYSVRVLFSAMEPGAGADGMITRWWCGEARRAGRRVRRTAG